MLLITEENKESLRWHLVSFHGIASLTQNEPIGLLAEKYVENELAMAKGMQDYYDEIRKEEEANKNFLDGIKKRKGATFFKYLMEIIEESEGIKGLAQIVKEPIGSFQKDKKGRQIEGIWVNQYAAGDSGDSWYGTVCVKIDENEYLKFGYSM